MYRVVWELYGITEGYIRISIEYDKHMKYIGLHEVGNTESLGLTLHCHVMPASTLAGYLRLTLGATV